MAKSTVPKWIPQIKREKRRKQWAAWYKRPWTVPTGRMQARRFKKALWKHGLLSPNFSRESAKSGDGVGIPLYLRKRAQRHAFALERVRHDLGDKPLSPLSWYRSGTPGVNNGHNAAVGGAVWSRHKMADATDWSNASDALSRSLEKHCTGLGYNPGRKVRHGDNGPERTWNYY